MTGSMDLRHMDRRRVLAIVKKDLREITANRMAVIPMIIVPIILCVLVPSGLLLAGLLLGDRALGNLSEIEGILPLYPVPADLPTMTARLLYVFLNYSFLPLFLLIPIMTATIVSANSIVGEKERRTLETLLYTPVTNTEFLFGKLLSAFLPAVALGLLAFLCYALATNAISLILAGFLIVRSLIWIPAILLLMPAVSLLGLTITMLVSLRAKTFMEAQQIAGAVVLPLILLLVAQIGGIVTFNVLFVFVFTAVLLAVSWFLLTKLGPRFAREKIISTL